MEAPPLSMEATACFADFVGKHADVESLSRVAEFCDINVAQVQRWQRGEYFPEGERLVKLLAFLDTIGYEVKELNHHDPGVKSLALIVGFGIITPVQAEQALYGDQAIRPANLWRILNKSLGSAHLKSKIARLVRKHAKELARRTTETQEALAHLAVAPEESETTKVSPSVPPITFDRRLPVTFGHTVRAVVSLGALIEAAGPDAVLAAIRETNGGSDLHELSDLLSRLLAST